MKEPIYIGGRPATIEDLRSALAEMEAAKAKKLVPAYPTEVSPGFAIYGSGDIDPALPRYAIHANAAGNWFPTHEDAEAELLIRRARAKGQGWIPEVGQECWFIQQNGGNYKAEWLGDDCDYAVRRALGIFPIKEAAEAAYTPEVRAAMCRPPVMMEEA